MYFHGEEPFPRPSSGFLVENVPCFGGVPAAIRLLVVVAGIGRVVQCGLQECGSAMFMIGRLSWPWIMYEYNQSVVQKNGLFWKR